MQASTCARLQAASCFSNLPARGKPVTVLAIALPFLPPLLLCSGCQLHASAASQPTVVDKSLSVPSHRPVTLVCGCHHICRRKQIYRQPQPTFQHSKNAWKKNHAYFCYSAASTRRRHVPTYGLGFLMVRLSF